MQTMECGNARPGEDVGTGTLEGGACEVTGGLAFVHRKVIHIELKIWEVGSRCGMRLNEIGWL
jgi:hypothetical protein